MLVMLGIEGLMLVASIGGIVRSQAGADRRWQAASEILVLTDDRAFRAPGCDAVSVFRAEQPFVPLFTGPQVVSPGRAAISRLGTVIASISANADTEIPFLLLVTRDPDTGLWEQHFWESEEIVWLAAPGVSADGSRVYVPIHRKVDDEHVLRVYSTLSLLETGLADPMGDIPLGGAPVRVFFGLDRDELIVVTTEPAVYRGDAEALELRRIDVLLYDIREDDELAPTAILARSHASISWDGRYLVTNRWRDIFLNVVDLRDETSMPYRMAGVDVVGGVAFSRAGRDHRFVVNTLDALIRFDIAATGVREVHRVPLEGIDHSLCFDVVTLGRQCSGPLASVAWGIDGHVVAAGSHAASEFAVFEFGPDRAVLGEWLTLCEDLLNIPNDIVFESTAFYGEDLWNYRVEPTATRTARAWTQTPPPESTPTQRPSEAPTEELEMEPIYMPIALGDWAGARGSWR